MSRETATPQASVAPVRRLDQQLRAQRRFDTLRRFARSRLAVVGLVFVALIVAMAITAPLIATHAPTEQSLFRRLQGPSSEHYFGTDELGRDVFSRVVFGARYSLFIGVSGAIGGVLLGMTLGMLSGYFGTWVDQVIMRIIDIMLSFPGVLMAILIVSVLGPGIYNLIVALTIWFTPTIARLIRSTVLSLKGQEFIIAAYASGAGDLRIMARHLLPNALSPLIVYGTLSVAVALLVAAGLSFLGLGAQPPTPEWGAMIGSGRQYLRDAPNATLFPGLAIFFTVLSLNFIGDALRDALDPRMRSEGRMSQ
jgi:peptide/nickel transport system permease protein